MNFVEFLAKDRGGKCIEQKVIPATDTAIAEVRDYYLENVYTTIWQYENEVIENPCIKVIAPLYFDLDSKGDLETARREASNLIETFEEVWGIPHTQISVYFSGFKGFHVEIPSECFGVEPRNDLHIIYKSMVTRIVQELKLKTIELDVYDRRRKWRIPNSINEKSGLYKIPLTYKELREFSIEQIKELAKIRREIEIASPILSEKANRVYEHHKSLMENKGETEKPKREFIEVKSCANIPVFPCVESLLKGVCEGERDNACFELAVFFKTRGMGEEEIIKKLLFWNDKNSPPLDGHDIEKSVNSAYKGDYKIGCSREILKRYCHNDCFLKTGGGKEESEAFFDKKNGSFIPKALGDEIIKKYRFVTRRDSEEIFVYMEGIYKIGAESIIKEEARLILGERCREHYVNEVVAHIKETTYASTESFESPKNLLCLRNGILELNTLGLEKHTPEIIFLNKLDISYNPEAKCPGIEKFLSEIVSSEYVPAILEFIGYCLYPGYPYHKALMCVGDGANGKSTLLELITRFLGKANVANVPLQDLDSNRFASSYLYGKLANIYADLPTKALNYTGKFKMLTGGDTIIGERKFRDGFSFSNHAKLIFSCNKVPEGYDGTTAFYRRWIMVNFPNVFTENKADKHLLEKLAIDEELSGLLNLALQGLKRLLGNGEFSNHLSIDRTTEIYERMSSPLLAFIQDCVMQDAEGWIAKDEFYTIYVRYCQDNKLPAYAKNVVSKDLPRHLPNITEERRSYKGNRVRGWKGIRLSEVQGVQGVHPFPYFKAIEGGLYMRV